MADTSGPSQGITDILGIGSILGDLFGSSGRQDVSGTTTSRGTQTRQLELDQAAIAKIIEDVLGGPGGLASIFGGEQAAGIFGSSVSAQASGDLVSKLVGELAKLTSREVTTQEAETTTDQRTESKDGGLLGAIKGIF